MREATAGGARECGWVGGPQTIGRLTHRPRNFRSASLRACSTGHAGMEMALSNLVEPGETILVGINGIWVSRSRFCSPHPPTPHPPTHTHTHLTPPPPTPPT